MVLACRGSGRPGEGVAADDAAGRWGDVFTALGFCGILLDPAIELGATCLREGEDDSSCTLIIGVAEWSSRAVAWKSSGKDIVGTP